jgi:branched-chain amino acid transport system permease protein
MNERTQFGRVGFPILIVLFLLLPFALSGYWKHVFALIFIKVVLALSLRQMLLTGLLNLSVVSFMAIGAYFSAVMTTTVGISFWLIMPLSGIFCFLIGVGFSFPVLRLKGAYFFIGTTAFAVAIIVLFSNFFVETLGGIPGFTPISVPRIDLPGLQIRLKSNMAHYYLAGVVMMLSAWIMYRLESSRYGIVWKAISQSDRLIEAVGVNLFKYKMLNFSISCFFAGICGSVYAPILGIITPRDFGLEFLFILVALLVVGGVESFWGPILGVVTVSIIAEFLRDFGQYELFGYGFVLVLAMLFMPQGLAGLLERVYAKRQKGGIG